MSRTPKDMQPGYIHKTKHYGNIRILSYKSYTDVDVLFLESGWVSSFCSGKIRAGYIKDKLSPSVYGVGFIGEGGFKTKINGKVTDEYSHWNGMLRRCYSKEYHDKYPTYKDCEVCKDWHNFQNFAEWFNLNKKHCSSDIHLDKDLIKRGNKIYSPDFCLLLYHSINTFISSGNQSEGLLIGVNFESCCSKYRAQLSNQITGKQEHIGLFKTEIEAHLAWASRKKEIAILIANSDIHMCDKTRNALLNIDFRQVNSSED